MIRATVAWRPVVAIAAAAAALHLTVATRYGWHRDEFYYVASGRHLAWGYPDQPPLTPVIARLAAAVPGGVLPLRVVVIAVQAATIVLGGITAYELGGSRRAQLLGAGAVAGCGVFVGASLFLGTTPLDQFMWSLIVLATLRAVRIRSLRAWVLVGVAGGIGLENKHTVAILLIATIVGLVLCQRPRLSGSGPWVAGVTAAAIWAPNLIWDAQHHWVTLKMARVIADNQGGVVGALSQVPVLLLVLPAPPLIFLWVRGVRFAAPNGPGRDHSWLIVTASVVVVATVAGGGKPYYAAPLLLPLFALGAVATEQLEAAGHVGVRWATRLVVLSVVASPVVSLPVVSPEFSTFLRTAAKEPMETYGWPNFAAQVFAIVDANPHAIAVYAGNYGEAGALEQFRHRGQRAVPVVSGHNSYAQWGPPSGTPTEVVAVGQFDRAFLEKAWTQVTFAGRIRFPDGLKNDESDKGAIFVCRGPRGDWADLWPTLSFLG